VRPTLPLIAAALAAPGLCLADPTPPPAGSEVIVADLRVEPLEVTRLPELAADAPDVTVITRADIDARQALYAAQVLDTVPGLALTDDGGFGGVSSVRMRGASSDKTLVLIDGIPQNDPSDPNGAYDFANLDLSNVERIEVLQGPQSSIWGSDAIGGVISLTTRETDGWRAQAEGGSLDSFDGSAQVGQRTDQYAWGASVFGDRSDGVAKADGPNGLGIGPRDPYWSWNAGGYGRYDATSWLTLDGHLRYEQSYAGVDGYDATTFAFGYTPQYATTRGWTGDVRATAQAPLGFTDSFTFGYYDLDRSDIYLGQPADSSSYWAQTMVYRFEAERGGPGDRWGVDFGAERQSTDASLSTGDRLNLGTTSGFVVARFSPLAPLTLTASERYDAPDSFAASATGRVSAVLKLPAGFSIEGAWGQGFKTPTISELACDFCFPTGPSLDLKPEHAVGWDAAVAWASPDGGLTAKLTGYRLAVRDQIAFAADFPFRYVNIDDTRTDGLEATARARITDNLSLDAEYAYTDAVDLDAMTQMLRVPRNAGSVTLNWTQGRWQASVTVRAEGKDADINPSTFAPQERPGFVIANLAASYALTPKLDLTARIDDIANTRYEEALGYGEPRQMLFFGIRARS
jgi:vitamin B12 transporter